MKSRRCSSITLARISNYQHNYQNNCQNNCREQQQSQ